MTLIRHSDRRIKLSQKVFQQRLEDAKCPRWIGSDFPGLVVPGLGKALSLFLERSHHRGAAFKRVVGRSHLKANNAQGSDGTLLRRQPRRTAS